MTRWLRRAWRWYLDRYRLVALIDVPPISGGMAPLPLLLGLGSEAGAAPTGGGRNLLLRRRRRS